MRLPLSLAVASLLVACSSSSPSASTSTATPASEPAGSQPALGGSAKVRTCKNKRLNPTRTPDDDVCDRCGATQCADESAAGIGTDPDAFGGACADTVSCICECDAADKTCLAKCPLPSGACNAALEAVKSCENAHCATECAKK